MTIRDKALQVVLSVQVMSRLNMEWGFNSSVQIIVPSMDSVQSFGIVVTSETFLGFQERKMEVFAKQYFI